MADDKERKVIERIIAAKTSTETVEEKPVTPKKKVDHQLEPVHRSMVEPVPTLETTYTILIDDYTTTNMIYVGKALVGEGEDRGVWQIKTFDETGDYLKIRYADGRNTFDHRWSDRTLYTYF